MPRIDIGKLPVDTRTGYPKPFDRVVVGRERKRLGNAVGLDQFGVNLTTLKPGAASALRHWHENEDEFVYVLEGEVVLIDRRRRDACSSRATRPASRLTAAMAITSSTEPIATRSILEIGTRAKYERADYPDVDLMVVRDDKGMRYTHKNGDPYG